MAERSVEAPLDAGVGDEFKSFEIKCASCAHKFLFSSGEQKFYKEKGLAHQPKRCRSCRFARKPGGSGNPTGSAGRTGGADLDKDHPGPPPALPKYSPSLSINALPGLVLNSDAKGFTAAVHDGRIVYVRRRRKLAVGTYVTFTKATTTGDFYLLGVSGASHPSGLGPVCMKATVLDIGADSLTLRAHFDNATLSCGLPSFGVTAGQKVLFEAKWSDGKLSACAISNLKAVSSLTPTRESAWGSWTGNVAKPSRVVDILHPEASSHLASLLGFTHDVCCPPALSGAAFTFLEEGNIRAVPGLSLLRIEEKAVPATPGSSPSDSHIPEKKGTGITTYLLRGTRSTGHLLADFLRKSFSEIDSLGLERRAVVLYPIDEGVTPENFVGTVNSKLFQTRLLPIRRIEVLSEPVPLAQVRLPRCEMTGRVSSQRMVAVHYELSAGLALSPLPPIALLETGPLSLDQGSGIGRSPRTDLSVSTQLRDEHDPALVVKFSIPKGALELAAQAAWCPPPRDAPAPCGTRYGVLLHHL